MNILFYGAGVLGSLYAAKLRQAGHEVTILARGQRLADLREHGLVLENVLTGERTETRVNVVEQLEPEDAYDLVVVLMRKTQVASILPVLAANRHTPNVLFMVNNAAGPDEYIRALGRERVLLGFPGAGGMRDGHIIRYVIPAAQPVTLGELNGQRTPRLQQIVEMFTHAGFTVSVSPNMDAWLKTHVALVSPIANALYMAGVDNYRMTRTPDAMILMVRAMREGIHVLRTLHIPVIPLKFRLLARLPEPLLVFMLRRAFNKKAAEIALAGHANAARDEMRQVADEFRTLAKLSGVPTPAIEHLYNYLDPGVPPVPEGSAQISMDWRGVAFVVEAVVGLVAVVAGLLVRRNTHDIPVKRRKAA